MDEHVKNKARSQMTLSSDDILFHSDHFGYEEREKVESKETLKPQSPEDHDMVDRIRHLDLNSDLKQADDNTSTTSSGVSSGGSTSVNSHNTTPVKNCHDKKSDVTLGNWDIWHEDRTYDPKQSMSEIRKLRRAKSEEDTKKKRFSFLKRFSLKESHSSRSLPRDIPLKTVSKGLRVDTLPQYFVVKYLGHRRCSGLYGLKHIRKPVDEMLEAVGHLKANEDLTLAQLHFTKKGVHMSAHSDNKGPAIPSEFLPIEVLSYGVQDHIHTRVFCLIVVRTIARHAKKMDCHAFVCNCSATAKKLALSAALAFNMYAETLKEKPYKFEVDLNSKKKSDDRKSPVENNGAFEV